MKYHAAGAIFIVGVLATFCKAVPLYDDELLSYQKEPYEEYESYAPYVQVRERRSPQQKSPPQQPNFPPPPPPRTGSISISGGHTTGQGNFVRGEYSHKLWQGKNGARFDASPFYQRNWGGPGPRHDYGGGVSFSAPL